MQRLDVHVEREHKRSRTDREKIIRLTVLFFVIAAITALIIYLIIPSDDDPAAETEATQDTAAENTGNQPGDQGNNAGDQSGIQNAGNSGSDQSDTGNKTAGSGQQNDASAQKNADDSKKQTETGKKVTDAKYDPSVKELFTETGKLPQMLKDGSWKKKDFAVAHVVGSNEYVSTLAPKYNNTQEFVRYVNNLDAKYTIRLNDKLYFLRADDWQITISRKNGTLQLNRIVSGREIPFAIFECKINPRGKNRDDLVICSHQYNPRYNADNGRRIKHGDPENPYGKYLLALAGAKNPDAPIYYLSIHDCKDKNSEATPLKNGATVLNTEDISLLYMLAPDKTRVRIVE